MVKLQVHLKSSPARAILRIVEGELTIGQVAARSGVAASALRFYEERGLIHPVRNSGGHRRYLRSVLRRVAFIVFAQRVGLTLDDVGVELAKLPENRVPESTDWARLANRWAHRIDDRIAELERLKAGLTGCISCGCLSLERCRIANPSDRAARHGPGPVYWRGQPSGSP
jgi:MerR family transcriptional regulator, redox-sensitive transcriptional activator SoxR